MCCYTQGGVDHIQGNFIVRLSIKPDIMLRIPWHESLIKPDFHNPINTEGTHPSLRRRRRRRCHKGVQLKSLVRS